MAIGTKSENYTYFVSLSSTTWILITQTTVEQGFSRCMPAYLHNRTKRIPCRKKLVIMIFFVQNILSPHRLNVKCSEHGQCT
jgi:hypothetical protein